MAEKELKFVMTATTERFDKALDKVRAALVNIEKNGAKAFDTVEQKVEETAKTFEKVEQAGKTAFQEIGNASKTVKASIDKASQAVEQFEAKTEKALASIDKIGRQAAIAFTVAAGGIGVAAKQFGDFERTMNGVKAVTGATTAQMKQLREAAIQIGIDTQFSVTEAAGAFFELGKAGLNAQQSIEAIPGVVNLAAAAGIDLANASEVAAGTVRGFGLAMSDTTKVADVLAQAANSSSVDVSDLAQSFKFVAPVARASGQSLESMAGILAILGNNMIKGEQAGTSLRAAMLKLQAPTKESAAALSAVGIQVADAQGKMKSFPKLIEELAQKTARFNDISQARIFEEVFGLEAVSAIQALVQTARTAPQEFDALIAQMDHASGAAKRMADEINQGLSFSLTQLKGSLDTAAVTFGEQLAPHIIKAADSIRELTNSFAALTPAEKKILADLAVGITVFLGATAAIAGLIRGGYALAGAFVYVTANAAKLYGFIVNALKPIIVAMGIAFGAAGTAGTGAMAALGVAARSLLGPLGLVLLAIDAIQRAWDHYKATSANDAAQEQVQQSRSFTERAKQLNALQAKLNRGETLSDKEQMQYRNLQERIAADKAERGERVRPRTQAPKAPTSTSGTSTYSGSSSRSGGGSDAFVQLPYKAGSQITLTQGSHNGADKAIDLAGAPGSEIVASITGVIEKINRASAGGRGGNEVVIRSLDGRIHTLISHLEKVFVKTGQSVVAGETIGTQGATGRARGAHGHFQVWKDGQAVNPLAAAGIDPNTRAGSRLTVKALAGSENQLAELKSRLKAESDAKLQALEDAAKAELAANDEMERRGQRSAQEAAVARLAIEKRLLDAKVAILDKELAGTELKESEKIQIRKEKAHLLAEFEQRQQAEAAKIAVAQIEFERALQERMLSDQKTRNAETLSSLKNELDAGRLTYAEYFEAKAALDEQDFARERALIQARVEEFRKGTKERQNAEKDLAQFEASYRRQKAEDAREQERIRVQATEQAVAEIEGINQSEHARDIQRINQRVAEMQKAGVDTVTIYEWIQAHVDELRKKAFAQFFDSLTGGVQAAAGALRGIGAAMDEAGDAKGAAAMNAMGGALDVVGSAAGIAAGIITGNFGPAIQGMIGLVGQGIAKLIELGNAHHKALQGMRDFFDYLNGVDANPMVKTVDDILGKLRELEGAGLKPEHFDTEKFREGLQKFAKSQDLDPIELEQAVRVKFNLDEAQKQSDEWNRIVKHQTDLFGSVDANVQANADKYNALVADLRKQFADLTTLTPTETIQRSAKKSADLVGSTLPQALKKTLQNGFDQAEFDSLGKALADGISDPNEQAKAIARWEVLFNKLNNTAGQAVEELDSLLKQRTEAIQDFNFGAKDEAGRRISFEKKQQLDLEKLKADKGKTDEQRARRLRDLKKQYSDQEAADLERVGQLQDEILKSQQDEQKAIQDILNEGVAIRQKSVEQNKRDRIKEVTDKAQAERKQLSSEIKRIQDAALERKAAHLEQLTSIEEEEAAAQVAYDNAVSRIKNEFEEKKKAHAQRMIQLDGEITKQRRLTDLTNEQLSSLIRMSELGGQNPSGVAPRVGNVAPLSPVTQDAGLPPNPGPLALAMYNAAPDFAKPAIASQIWQMRNMGVFGFNKGAIVPGSGDRDSVLAALTPGEAVIPKNLTQLLLQAAGRGGGAQTHVAIQINHPVVRSEQDIEKIAMAVKRVWDGRFGMRGNAAAF